MGSHSIGPLHPYAPEESASRSDRSDADMSQSARKCSRECWLRHLTENIDVVCWISDPSITRIHYVNSAYEKVWGQPRTTLRDRPQAWMDAIHPEDRAAMDAIVAGQKDRQDRIDVEFRIVRPDGQVRWIHARTFPVRVSSGQVTGFAGIAEDVTARKAAEDALRQERAFDESLVELAHAIVLVLDRKGRIQRFNSYLERMTGFALEEVRGSDWLATFVAEAERPRFENMFAQLLARGDSRGWIGPIVGRDGRQRAIEWFTRLLPDGYGAVPGVLVTGHDITDLVEAQQRALQAERLAAIGQMVTGLAHESRNALQRSQMNLERLTLRLGGQPEALDLAARVQRAQDRLHYLYESVREFAAPLQLHWERVDLRALLRMAWNDLAPRREGRAAQLLENIREGELACDADAIALVQVFGNILENSLRACSDPAVIEVCWSTEEVEGKTAVGVRIRDNGPGLTPEQRQRIFEPFYTTRPQGTGLGMAIARRIVEAHGGQISAGCGPEQGAELRILLPMERS